MKMTKFFKRLEKCGKRRSGLLRVIFPIPTAFSKRLVLQKRKNQGLYGKGLKVGLNESVKHNRVPYLPTILENVLCLILQIFLYLEAYECTTTSEWLNLTV